VSERVFGCSTPGNKILGSNHGDPRGEKTALDLAVAVARQRELAEQPRQLALFDTAP